MNAKYVLHRLVLIFMFAICSIAVILFIKQRANASLGGNFNSSVTDGVAGNVKINGACSRINGTRVSAEPTGDKCISGIASSIAQTNTGWGWKCYGTGGGTSSYCNVIKYVPAIDTDAAAVVNTNTTGTTNTADAIGTSTTNTATTATTGAATNTANTTAAEMADVQVAGNAIDSTSTLVSETVTDSSGSDEGNDGRNDRVTAKAEKPEIENKAPTSQPEQQQVEQQKMEERQPSSENSLQEVIPVEKSPIIAESVVIEAKNLAQDNNPKISGTVGGSLKVEKVVLNKKDDGGKKIALSGKSEPNALVTIYIFSSDPVVITVRADADGNWNYELDKELADGQHEAYVTVADDAGKIVSKSEPIAFIKTAEAATVIPISVLEGNQSPMENSVQQFILMAIVVMSICLAIALAAIGFLSHKKNPNERIN